MVNFFIAVTFILAVSRVEAALKQSEFGPKILELIETLHSTCIAKSGTDEDSIKKVIQGQFTDEPKIKNYMACLFKESGVIEENGDLNMDMLTQLIPPKILEVAVKITKNCRTQVKAIPNISDRVFAFLKCFYEQNPEIFIFF